MKIKACLRCGYCCKKSLCAFGERKEGDSVCKYLGGEKIGDHYCKEYQRVSQKVWAQWNPAFGKGCCAPSIPSEEHLYKDEDVAKCMWILLRQLAQEMISPDVWSLAMGSAQKMATTAGVENTSTIYNLIAKDLLSARKKSLAGKLDEVGFY